MSWSKGATGIKGLCLAAVSLVLSVVGPAFFAVHALAKVPLFGIPDPGQAVLERLHDTSRYSWVEALLIDGTIYFGVAALSAGAGALAYFRGKERSARVMGLVGATLSGLWMIPTGVAAFSLTWGLIGNLLHLLGIVK